MTQLRFLKQSVISRLSKLEAILSSVPDDVSSVHRGYYDALQDEVIYLKSVISKCSEYGQN